MKIRNLVPETAFLAMICGFWGAAAEEGDTLWSLTYRGPDIDQAQSLVQTDNGGYLLAGQTYSYGAGSSDAWLVRTNNIGESLWRHTYGGIFCDVATAIIKTNDGNYAFAGEINYYGTLDYDMWLVKVDTAGSLLWSSSFGGPSWDKADALVQSDDGGYLLAGFTNSYGAGSSDLWLLKADSDGDSLWSKTYGWIFGDGANAITKTSDGNFLVAGLLKMESGDYDLWMIKLNQNGDSIWARTFGGDYEDWPEDVIETQDGYYLVAGKSNNDGWLLKTDLQGNLIWSRTYGGFYYSNLCSVIEPSGGGYLLVGTRVVSWNDYDLWVLKTDTNGDTLWSRTYNFGLDNWANQVLENQEGNYIMAGGTYPFSLGEDDMWLVCVQGPGTAVQPQPPAQPAQFALHPAHPNPFNASTVLPHELQAPGQVNLRVYDTAGRLVQTLVDGWRDAGSHEVTFDAGDLPSGMYFARLEAGEYVGVQKLILLK